MGVLARRALPLGSSACLAAVVLLAGPAGAAEIRALGGTWDEPLTSIREESGRLVLRTPQRAVPLDEVKSIRFQDVAPQARPDRRNVKVLLLSGDALRGVIQGAAVDAKGNLVALNLDSQGLGQLPVPIGLVRAIIIDATQERERALEGALDAHDELDLVQLKDGGTARGSVTLVDGTRVSIDTKVTGGTNADLMTFDFAKVELVSIAALEQPPAPAPGVRVQVRLVDGSNLTGKLKSLDGPTLRLDHPLGGQAELQVQVSRVAELDVKNGAFVYLSDLEPKSADQHFPPEYFYEPDVWGWKRDRNVTGGALRLGGRVFDKGLGVHSYCALTFTLDRAYKQLKATIGLDDATRYLGEPGFGAVVFRVLLDGKPARELPPTGITKRKGDPPQELTIDVSTATTVTLVADFDPTTLHILGRADWADVHVIKR